MNIYRCVSICIYAYSCMQMHVYTYTHTYTFALFYTKSPWKDTQETGAKSWLLGRRRRGGRPFAYILVLRSQVTQPNVQGNWQKGRTGSQPQPPRRSGSRRDTHQGA